MQQKIWLTDQQRQFVVAIVGAMVITAGMSGTAMAEDGVPPEPKPPIPLADCKTQSELCAERVNKNQDVNTRQDKELTDVRDVNTRQDKELTDVREVNTRQDKELTDVREVNTRQDKELTDVREVNTRQDKELTDVREVNTRQDQELTDVRGVNTRQDQELMAVRGVNTRQDQELTAVRGVNTRQDQELTAVRGVNTRQDQELTAVREVNTRQDKDIATNRAGIADNANRINNAFDEIDENTQGIAIAIAMGGLILPSDKRFALSASLGFYDDKTAIAAQGAVRLNRTWTLNGGLGFGADGNRKVGGRIGISAAW